MTEERISQLEITVAHQAKEIEDLSDIVNKQYKDIEKLKSFILKTKGKLDNIESIMEEQGLSSSKSLVDSLAEEVPPHY